MYLWSKVHYYHRSRQKELKITLLLAYVQTFSILIDKTTKKYYLLSTNKYVLIGIIYIEVMKFLPVEFLLCVDFQMFICAISLVHFNISRLSIFESAKMTEYVFYSCNKYSFLRCLHLSRYLFILKRV